MQIHGFQKTTLLDYPGHLAATIFLGGCNFRCPFCQNKELVLSPNEEPSISPDEVLKFFKTRQGILEGVCISGGEPTLEKDLENFIKDIKNLGYKVKLDTNGYCPEVLESLLDKNLLDYVAMDIKSSPEDYPHITGLSGIDIHKINRSVHNLMASQIDYEFRTTIVKEYHSHSHMESIGKWLQGCKAYYLQNYRDSDSVILPGLHSHKKETLHDFRTLLLKYIDTVEIRGI